MQVEGTIKRRLLVNYRVPLARLAAKVPEPLRPKPVPGSPSEGLAGVCLIRLEHMRPAGLPAFLGQSSENLAHRIAVEWAAPDGSVGEGVYIPSRHTASRTTRLAGRLVNTLHGAAAFDVQDDGTSVAVRARAADLQVEVRGRQVGTFRSDAFRSLPEASEFFQAGCVGYSSRPDGSLLGVRLSTDQWQVQPFEVEHASSSYLQEELGLGPQARVDCALVMRDVEHRWDTETRPAPVDAAARG